MPALDAVAEVALAVAFAYAAATKFYDRERFADVLRAGGLRDGDRVVSAAVPAAEVLVAAGIVVGGDGSQRLALAATVVMLGAFSGWLLRLHRRRLRVPCRCFGSDADTRLGPALARNGAMAAVALACMAAEGPLPLPLSGLSAALVTGTVLVLWATYGVVLAWPALLKRLPEEAEPVG